MVAATETAGRDAKANATTANTNAKAGAKAGAKRKRALSPEAARGFAEQGIDAAAMGALSSGIARAEEARRQTLTSSYGGGGGAVRAEWREVDAATLGIVVRMLEDVPLLRAAVNVLLCGALSSSPVAAWAPRASTSLGAGTAASSGTTTEVPICDPDVCETMEAQFAQAAREALPWLLAAGIVGVFVEEVGADKSVSERKTPKLLSTDSTACPLGSSLVGAIATICAMSALENAGAACWDAFGAVLARNRFGLDARGVGVMLTSLACVSFGGATPGVAE